MLLKAKANYATETEDALLDGDYARAFRRIIKRRRAISQASPFSVSILGIADSYALFEGKLLYIVGDHSMRDLRILDLQKATNQEVVVHVPTLMTQAVPESKGCRKYIFRILNHAVGITTCLYTFARPATQNWLFIFQAQEHRLIDKIRLDSTIRLFVRNNSHHLIFGTHSEYDAQGNRKWVFRYYNIQSRSLCVDKIHMPNLVGYEIGTTVCFEIFDAYFYGCSNQTSFELEEIDWTSHYYCFRFPLNQFEPRMKEVMNKRDAFRRRHTEGPIDDRWTFLTLNQDEETGSIKIIECRREWLNGTSENRRTYYNKEVKFPNRGFEINPDSTADDVQGGNDPLPDEQLARLLGSSDRPNYVKAPKRSFQEYHSGDPGPVMFSKNKTYLSTYSLACGTFMDLVDDPLPNDPCTQRLRIRTGSKAGHVHAAQHGPQERLLGRDEVVDAAQRNVVSCWPPSLPSGKSAPHKDLLESLGRAMNPAGLCGSVTAAYDGRSIVYSTSGGGSTASKVLICVSFDPAVKLAGMIRAGCLHAEIVNDDNSGKGAINGILGQEKVSEMIHHAKQWPCRRNIATQPADAALSPPQHVQWSEKENLEVRTRQSSEKGPLWVRIDNAMHQEFSAKYAFGFH
ncbi:hypothetical protein TruAng_003917 [Truncatella angustata]|nr:hypothetical protein TruAng_003917 [Truncatella angustata]